MVFEKFCMSKSPSVKNEITTTNCNVPEQYNEALRCLVDTMRFKMSRLDRIHVSFIEDAIDNVSLDDIQRVLGDSMDVPDSIILTLSSELYGKHYNDLEIKEQQIIRMLAVYLTISNK